VDGTSFAAPIVSSLADPSFTPGELKRLVLRTARRLPHVEVDRQGWGVVDVRRACLAAVASRTENLRRPE
jgi:serine protease AprX